MNLEVIITFKVNELLFQYDVQKCLKNYQKHRISFRTAAHVFLDELRDTRFNRWSGDEARWQTIGEVGNEILFVVFTNRRNSNGEKVIHIISARKTNKKERKRMGLTT